MAQMASQSRTGTGPCRQMGRNPRLYNFNRHGGSYSQAGTQDSGSGGRNDTRLLQYYFQLPNKNNSFKNIVSKPNTRWISRIMFDNGIINNNQKQRSEILDVDIFPDYVFCGTKNNSETHILHHFNGSWL